MTFRDFLPEEDRLAAEAGSPAGKTVHRGASIKNAEEAAGVAPPSAATPSEIRFSFAGLPTSIHQAIAPVSPPNPEIQAERKSFIDNATIAGMAWSGMALSEKQSEAVATAMWRLAGTDPEFKALLDEDFEAAFSAGISELGEAGTNLLAEDVFDETMFMLYELAGDTANRDRMARQIGVDPETGLSIPEEDRWYSGIARGFSSVMGWAAEQVGEGGAWLTDPEANAAGVRGTQLGAIATSAAAAAQFIGATVQQNQRAEIIGQAQLEAQLMANPNLVMAAAAAQLVADYDMTLPTAASMAREAFNLLPPEEQAEMLQSVQDLTSEELVSQAEELLDEVPVTPEQRVMTGMFEVASVWDAVVHSFGIGLTEAASGGGVGDNPYEGVTDVESFFAAFEEVREEGYAGYWGLEEGSAEAGWVNLGASIVFDPTTWIAPTPRKAGQQFTDIMSDVGKFDAWLTTSKGRSFVRTLTRDDPRINLMLTAGMSPENALKIFRSTDADTISSVLRTEIQSGTWMMDYHALAKQHRAITGFGQYVQRLRDVAIPGSGRLSERARESLDWVVDMVQRTDERRVVQLGEAGSSRDMVALMMSRFRNDPDGMREAAESWFRVAADGDTARETARAELRAQGQSLEQQMQAVQDAMDPYARAAGRAERGIRRLPVEVDKLAARIDDMKAQVAGMTGDAAARMRETIVQAERTLTSKRNLLERYQTVWAEHGARYGEGTQQLVDLRTQMNNLEQQLGLLESAKSRQVYREWAYNMYDDWAESIGVPVLDDAASNVLLKYDWDAVRGLKAEDVMSISRSSTRDAADAFGGAAPLWRQIDAQDPNRMFLPASPQEMILWETLRGSQATHRRVMRAIIDSRMSNGLNRLRQVWTAMLLFNPVTPIKSNLDEVFTFAQDAGWLSRDTMGAMAATVPLGMRRQFRAGSRAEEFIRDVINGNEFRSQSFSRLAAADMPTRGRGRLEYVTASKRFLEGTVMQQEILRQWARAYQAGDWQVFAQWWDSAANTNKRAIAMGVQENADRFLGFKPRQISSREVYEALNTFMVQWTGQAKDSLRFFDEMVEVLADPKVTQVSDSLAMRNPFAFTERRAGGNAAASIYDTLYGSPSRRRAGVFYDHYFDRARATYRARFSGRIIDESDSVSLLVERGLFRSEDEAMMAIRTRDPRVDRFLRDNGFVTNGAIDELSANWARNHAESLMYIHSASSVLGKAFGQVFPFGAATADFIRRWTGRMGRSPDFVTGARSIAQRGRSVSRFSHLVAEEGRTPDTADSGHPIQLLRDYTFLPLDFNDGAIFLDLVPGLGPIPSAAIHMMPADEDEGFWGELRGQLTRLFPAIDYMQGQLDLSEDGIRRLATSMIPFSSRSVPGLLQSTNRFASSFFGAEYPLWELERDPQGLREQVRAHSVTAIIQNPYANLDGPDSDLVTQINNDAYAIANREAGTAGMIRFFPGGQRSPFVRTQDSLLAWERFMTDPDTGIRSLSGLAGDPMIDQFEELWEKYSSTETKGSAMTREELGLMFDSAASLIWQVPDDVRDQIVAWYPEMAVLMVGTVEGVRDPQTGNLTAPDPAMFTADGRINRQHSAWQGDRAEDTYEEGFNEGWLAARPTGDIVRDIWYSAAEARKRVVRDWWADTFNEEWRGITSTTKGVREARVTLSESDLEALSRWGITGLTTEPVAGEVLHEKISDAMSSWSSRPDRESPQSPDNPFWGMVREASNRVDGFEQFESEFEAGEDHYKELGIDSVYDWEDEDKEWFRGQVAELLTFADDPAALRQMYDVHMSRAFGELYFEDPKPPPVDGLDLAIEVPEGRWAVVDGDTIEVLTGDGVFQRVRLIGLNAPEQGTVDWEDPDRNPYLEAKTSLAEIMRGREVTIGIFDPETYGVSQTVDADGTKRVFAWLYLDGRPLYDPSVFTATNRTGVETGGEVQDLEALYSGRPAEEE